MFCWLVCACLASAGSALRAAEGKLVSAIFKPARIEQPALSPDGRHVAYFLHDKWSPKVVIVDTANEVAKNAITIDDRTEARATSLQWVNTDCLVLATDSGAIFGVWVSTRQSQRWLDPQSFAAFSLVGRVTARRPRLVGVLPDDPDCVLIEGPAALESETELIALKLNVRTGARGRVDAPEMKARLGSVLYDRQGHPRVWLRNELLPERYNVRDSEPKSAWKPLDEVVGNQPVPWDFAITGENYLGQRSFPLAFDYDPNVLYVASNVGRETRAVYALDLRTRQRTPLAVEEPLRDLLPVDRPFDSDALVFDRGQRHLVGVRCDGAEGLTHWLDPDLAKTQAMLAAMFPARMVRVLSWDDGRARFLVSVSSASEPGRIFVWESATGRCVDYGRTASDLDPDDLGTAQPYAFDTSTGVHLSGVVTMPRAPRATPAPLVVVLHSSPWQRAESQFDREAAALADIGFVVATVNYRGSDGFGTGFRLALHESPAAGPVADAVAVREWVLAHGWGDPHRVAVMGEGFGGFIALSAAEAQPDLFRAAVAINSPLTLKDARDAESEEIAAERKAYGMMQMAAGAMGARPPRMGGGGGGKGGGEGGGMSGGMGGGLDGGGGMGGGKKGKGSRPPAGPIALPLPPPVDLDHAVSGWLFNVPREQLAVASVPDHAAQLKAAVLLGADPKSIGPIATRLRDFRDTFAKHGGTVELMEVPGSLARASGDTRVAALTRVGGFLNEHLYDFNVKVGEMVEKK